MTNLAKFLPNRPQVLNSIIIGGSVLLCLFLSLTRLPGMELLGIGPNWLLIWVVSWSLKRTTFQGLVAGISLGLIQDGLTSSYPSHILSLAIVGFLIGCVEKGRYLKEDFISVALLVFAMTILGETIIVVQYVLQGIFSLQDIWITYQKNILSSAILSSLWSPVIYYPLNYWLKRGNN